MNEMPSGAHVVLYRTVPTTRKQDGSGTAIRVVLLCKRTQDAPNYPGHWALFGGAVCQEKDRGDPRRTAVREANEELSGLMLRVESLEDLCQVRLVRGSNRPTVHYFKCELNRDMDELTLGRDRKEDKVEAEGFALFTQEEVYHLLMRPEDRVALNRFFEDEAHGVA